MKFSKPGLSLNKQVELLQSRGMGGDTSVIHRRLHAVNYYRLSAYWHTFKVKTDNEQFLTGTHIDIVWDRYIFDRALRVLAMDAIERFEICVRTRLAYELAIRHGPFGYSENVDVLYRDDSKTRKDFFERLAIDIDKQKRERFVAHFLKTYKGSHDFPPIWVAVEVMTFGGTFSLYKGCVRAIQREVAQSFGVAPKVLQSWLSTLNQARNICAHHGRLWNREFGIKPMIPRDALWHTPVEVGNDRLFGVLTVLAHIVTRVAPRSQWQARVGQLLDKHPDVPRDQMGFPERWKEHPVWARGFGGAQ